MSIKETIGIRIGKLRTENEMTQQQLAEILGVRREQINYYEADSRLPKLKEIIQLAELFKVTTDYILCVSDSRKAENADIAKRLGLTDVAVELLEKINGEKDDAAQISETDVVNMLLDEDAGRSIIGRIQAYLESDPTVENDIFVLYDGRILDRATIMADKDLGLPNLLTFLGVNQTIELGVIEGIKETISSIKGILWEQAIDKHHNEIEDFDGFKNYVKDLEASKKRIRERYPMMISNKKNQISPDDIINKLFGADEGKQEERE